MRLVFNTYQGYGGEDEWSLQLKYNFLAIIKL